MSQPASPTRLNRNAVCACGVAMRKSDAMAMIAPAPAAMPSTAEMIGLPQWSIALTRSPVMRVKASSSFIVHGDQRADDVVHVAAGTEIAAVGQEHDGVDVVGVGQRAKRVAQLGIGFEGQRIFALGPVQLDDGDARRPCARENAQASSAAIVVMLRPPSRCGTISAWPTIARRRAPRCRRAVRRPSVHAPRPSRRMRRGPCG